MTCLEIDKSFVFEKEVTHIMIYTETVFMEDVCGPLGERVTKDLIYSELINGHFDIESLNSDKIDNIEYNMSINNSNVEFEIVITTNTELTFKEVNALENWYKVVDSNLHENALKNGQIAALFGWLDKLKFQRK